MLSWALDRGREDEVIIPKTFRLRNRMIDRLTLRGTHALAKLLNHAKENQFIETSDIVCVGLQIEPEVYSS